MGEVHLKIQGEGGDREKDGCVTMLIVTLLLFQKVLRLIWYFTVLLIFRLRSPKLAVVKDFDLLLKIILSLLKEFLSGKVILL